MNQFEGIFDGEEWLNQNMDLGLMEVDTEDSTDSEAQVGSNGKKRNSYTIDYKLEAIDYYRSLKLSRLQRPAFGPQSNTELKVFIIDLFYSLFSVTDEPWMVNELHSSPQIQRKKGNAPL
ncbi:hypothetical protein DdX_18848 [Ditylenchus destructor]|uniref:Uncharacterized protein n=1 Tax=Ditylenchus destructor TaxID=166010 RepID=A0AAD4MP88_9BILA|nr:hypothetical protein DdX_18848 [Ditylenchus destructor]